MKLDSEHAVMQEEELIEKQIESEDIFHGVILHVKRDTVMLPNGNTAPRELIRHVGAVCIVPITEDNRVFVERQYRYPIDQVITEIPAGKLDFMGEDRLEAAKRELWEETGITADTWIDMGLYYPAAAYSDEKITMFLARGLHLGEQHLDADEFLNLTCIPIHDLVSDILSGVITDGKTQAAVLKAAAILNILSE